MKALTSLAIAIAATLFFACNTPNTTSQLKDDAQRKILINDLIANPDYTTQVMDAMMANNNAKQMMVDHNMKMMMEDTAMHSKMMHHMMGMMEKDTMMCKNMCSKMMDNPKMKSMMDDMMKHHGMKHDMKMDMKPGEKMKKK
jgi:hypothetical protein